MSSSSLDEQFSQVKLTEENDRQKLILDLSTLYKSQKYCKSPFIHFFSGDIILIVGSDETKFSCHKNILSARCLYFQEYFSKPETKDEQSIYFKDKKSKIFEIIIEYFYSGRYNQF
jgi:hypothetical protein